MSAWIPLAIGSGVGLLKYMDEKKEEPRKREIEQTKARYYPWLGLAPQDVKSPSIWDSVGGGALAGLGIGQNLGLKFGGGEAAAAPAQGGHNSDDTWAYDRYVGGQEPAPYYPPGTQPHPYTPGAGPLMLTPEQAQTARVQSSIEEGATRNTKPRWTRKSKGAAGNFDPNRRYD